MKRLSLVFALFILFVTVARAQDCLGLKFKAGASYELSSYNAKDKPSGRMTYQVKNVRKEGGNTVVDVAFQSFDDKDRALQSSTLKYTCSGNELLADLSGFMAGQQNPAFKDAEMRMKANRLIYPAQYKAGQTLPDGQLEAEFIKDGNQMAVTTMAMKNRQVAARESLTVPAGTFEVYKITSDVEMANRVMGINIPVTLRSVSYRTPDQLLDIRTETYNKNGKLMGYTVLSKIN